MAAHEETMPLVTLALITFNQERYVRQAVAGALSQEYPNLEIIISDDFSTDQTYEIAQSLARLYRGPHRVILNKNAKNLGVSHHINTVMQMAHGELIVIAAGDDISLPNRVGTIAQEFVRAGCGVMSIHSSVEAIDSLGNSIGIRAPASSLVHETASDIALSNSLIIGASHAWSAELFRKFQPLKQNVWAEDLALVFRSKLVGQIRYVDIPLVKYRVDSGVSSSASISDRKKFSEKLARCLRFHRILVQRQIDCRSVGNTALESLIEPKKVEHWIAGKLGRGQMNLLVSVRLLMSRNISFGRSLAIIAFFRGGYYLNRIAARLSKVY